MKESELTIKLTSSSPRRILAALAAVERQIGSLVSENGPTLTIKVKTYGDETATANAITDILAARSGVDAEVTCKVKEVVETKPNAPAWSDSPMGQIYGGLS